MINTVIFDAFGTLFKVEKGASAKLIIGNILSAGVEVDQTQFLAEWKSFYKNYTAPNVDFMTERNIFISRIQMFYNKYNISRNAVVDTDYMLAAAFERKTFDEVTEVIAELRNKYKVYIGSNTDNDVLDAVMKKNEVKVDKIYTSENLRCYKPNPTFFRKILEEHELKPENVIFVGDSVSDDILGPKALGIKTVLIDREKSGVCAGQDYTIDNLRELINILV